MRSFSTRYAALAASLIAAAHALDGIVVPDTIAAGTSVKATFENGSSDKYRVYLAAALTGVNGPTCYLMNSTSLSSPFTVTVPADSGPSADYYSIAISDLTTSQGATYSNRFNFTGGTGNYTEYEQHLGGAPFWSADDLPCTAYACARKCAQASYPDDLTSTSAYNTMKSCILECSGVSAAASQTGPAHGTSTGSQKATTMTAAEAMITLSSGDVMTAVETTVTSGGSKITEAVVGGSATLTLGGAEATISGEVLSMAKSGVVEVSESSTVAFSSMTMTTSVADTASATSASAAATSSGAASRQEMAIAGLAGVAGFAAFML
ncbi:hypothetical protein LTR85_002342 [Meristemomyces frigidus]|nr:hypothetical protein LTR85_002342 [Meristemomyces frigidus]